MSETLIQLLQSISDTRGFIMFCVVIALAYASIWALVLFEPEKKPRKRRSGGADSGEGGEGEEGEEGGQQQKGKQQQGKQKQQQKGKKAPAKREKQAA